VIVWLDEAFILMTHRAQIDEHGGLHGVKNVNALRSTLARPRQVQSCEPDASLFRMAGSPGFGFARNHCFHDGNKRTALISAETFLALNGWLIDGPGQVEKEVFYNEPARGDRTEAAFCAWLEEHAIAFDLDAI
jgi:death-on-curing protein